MGLVSDNKAEYDAAGIVSRLGVLRSKRFTVLHGDMDENVHFAHSRHLFEELAARYPEALTSGDAAIVCLPSERHSALYVPLPSLHMPPRMRVLVHAASRARCRSHDACVLLRGACWFAAVCATW